MQVSCPQCTTRLQLSAEKLPSQPFTIKCPKCENNFLVTPELPPEVVTQPPVPDSVATKSEPAKSEPAKLETQQPPPPSIPEPPPVQPPLAPPPPALALNAQAPSPPTLPPPVPPPAPVTPQPPAPPLSQAAPAATIELPAAPAAKPLPPLSPPKDLSTFTPNMAVGWTNTMPTPTASDDRNSLISSPTNGQDLLQALAALLTGGGISTTNQTLDQTRERHLMACLTSTEDLARMQAGLEGQPYQLTVAASPEEVTGILQSGNQLDILLLDPAFHSEQQGSASIMRYVNMLNPVRRRRVYVVVVSPSYRTLDTQAAFAQGVNLMINSGDLESLPGVLAKSIQEFNHLYRAYNIASGMSPF